MIAVIDYGMGNLQSVQKAIERVGGDARLVDSPAGLAGAQKIVLPGVAAFGDAMAQLRSQGLVEPIHQAVLSGTPYLGFCLGLQLLFDVGYEDGEHRGLGLLAGKVVRFDFADIDDPTLRIPHMGWNQLRMVRPCEVFGGIADGSHVYFAHSYHVVPDDHEIVATVTDYGRPFVSSVCKGNIYATQFHPEKSQAVGLKFLENFVRL